MKKKLERRWYSILLNNRGETGDEANETEESNPLEDALSEQLSPDEENTDGGAAAPAKEEAPAKKEGEEEEGDDLVDVEGYKGKDRRATGFSGEEKRKDRIEKRDNMELGFDFGHGDKASNKMSITEVKETLKWLQDNNEIIGAGLSMNKYSQQFPQFGKLVNAIVAGSFSKDNEFNADFATRVMSAVEKKEDVIEEEIDETDTEIARIQKILDDGEIDEDSPQADALRSSVKAMKAQKAQLGKALKSLEEISTKFEGFETKQTDAAQSKKDADYQAEKTRIAGLYSEELRTLTADDNKDGYKLANEQESKYFDSLVRQGVSNTVAALHKKTGAVTDEQLKKAIVENAKTSYEEITKWRESSVQDYLEKKGGKKPVKKDEEKEVPEAKDDMNLDDLTKTVEDMLPKE